jgi:hypothetical protein
MRKIKLPIIERVDYREFLGQKRGKDNSIVSACGFLIRETEKEITLGQTVSHNKYIDKLLISKKSIVYRVNLKI